MSHWNAAQYLKFQKERTQPAIDLANRIPLSSPESILDIGCGPGNSTQVLADRFPHGKILGIDNSQDMIAAARSQYPELEFALCDAGSSLSSLGKKFDLVFSNACIQWIPNHPALLSEMMKLLNPGGVMAVQTPMNYEEPIHRIIATLAESGQWKEKIGNPRIFYNLTPGGYFDLLSDISSDFTLWNTTYFHRMPSHESIMEWYKGTGLRPYLNALEGQDREDFERQVFHEVSKAYPKQKNGEIIFRFPRLIFMAVK